VTACLFIGPLGEGWKDEMLTRNKHIFMLVV
jgi:hypothetical protein